MTVPMTMRTNVIQTDKGTASRGRDSFIAPPEMASSGLADLRGCFLWKRQAQREPAGSMVTILQTAAPPIWVAAAHVC